MQKQVDRNFSCKSDVPLVKMCLTFSLDCFRIINKGENETQNLYWKLNR